jgi:peptidoglycan/xylan/chitin deacetylase (PgdA/CDA1 family)
MWYWIKTPLLVKKIFHKQLWDIPSKDPVVYLTFDDGPNKVMTEKVLAILSTNNVKRLFFA